MVDEMGSPRASRCYFADGPPTGLSDPAEDGWGMSRFASMFAEAHARYERHDDGAGNCRVCGCALDFETWMDSQDSDG